MFVDEFGHEKPTDPNHAPVFGYGGFIIPAESFSKFSTEFFDVKVSAFIPLYRARLSAKASTEGEKASKAKIKALLQRLGSALPQEFADNPDVRRAVAQYELKGSDVFSASYLAKLARNAAERGQPPSTLGAKGYAMVRFARWFLNVLTAHKGEIFYVGFHKSQAPILKKGDRIHLALVKEVIDRANQYAIKNNTVVKIIFDHHYTDIGHSTGPGGTRITGFVGKSRSERARELVIAGGYFENLTEPVFNAKSHLSQGIQAADWVCTLLRLLLVNRTEPESPFKAFAARLDEMFFSAVCDESLFRTMPRPLAGRQYDRQQFLDLKGGKSSDDGGRRPHRD